MSPNDYANKSIYGMEDPPKYALTSYYLFVLLSCLVGDTIILVASIKYRALRLHPFITHVIQNIAVSDLMVALVYVLPKVIAKIADGWVLGYGLCYFTAYGTYYFSSAGLLFICVLTSSKLIILKSPYGRRSLSAKKAEIVCGVVWVVSLTIPAMFLLVDRADVVFDYRTNVCSYHFTSSRWKLLKPIQALVFMVIPNFLVVACTILLVIHLIKARRSAKRCGGAQRWQGIMTTILTATVYCCSVLPYAVYRITESRFADRQGFFHNEYLRLSGVCLSLNTISNFYIYCLTVSSFREFLWLQLHYSASYVYNSSSSRGSSSDGCSRYVTNSKSLRILILLNRLQGGNICDSNFNYIYTAYQGNLLIDSNKLFDIRYFSSSIENIDN